MSISADKLRGRLKMVVLGESGVGKTSFVRRWTSNSFTARYASTVNTDFFQKEVTSARDGSLFAVEVWDTAGQERFASVTKNILRDVDVFVLCYDVETPFTAEKLRFWLDLSGASRGPGMFNAEQGPRVVIVGLKNDEEIPDIPSARLRFPAVAFASTWAGEMGITDHMLASAKSGFNVHNAMTMAVEIGLKRKRALGLYSSSATATSGIRFQPAYTPKKQQSCAC